MALAWEVHRDAVKACDWAGTVQVSMGVTGLTVMRVVMVCMTTSANCADDDVFGHLALINRVPKAMAAVALSNKRKRIEKFSGTWSAKHINWVCYDFGKMGAIFIKE